MSRADEVFQNLEPAHRLLTGWGVVTWEWREGIRSWLLPGLVAGLMGLGSTPFAGLTAVALGLSLISVSVVAAAMAFGFRQAGLVGALMCGVACAVWPDLVYYAPRALTEVQGGNMLVLGTILAAAAADRGPGRGRVLLAALTGLALGLAFCLRFQLAPAILVAAVWAGRTDWRGRWFAMLLGGLVPVALLGVTDTIAWGTPFNSIWRNFVINIAEGKAARFGVSPIYGYPGKAILLWGAGAVPFFVVFCLGVRRAMLPALVALAVVGSHTLIGHKEHSFIYGGIVLAVIVGGVGSAQAIEWLASRISRPWPAWKMGAVAGAAWVLTAATIMLSSYDGLLNRNGNYLAAISRVRGAPDLCGLAFSPGIVWSATAGYTYLNRQTPILLLKTEADLERGAAGANYLLVSDKDARPAHGFGRLACWDDICLYRRDGDCTVLPDLAINEVLRRNGN